MSTFKTKFSIINHLSGQTRHVQLQEIVNHLEYIDQEIHSPRKIKEYLAEMPNEGVKFENKKGRYGGYKLSKVTKNEMISVASKAMDKRDRNAINDAFELALCSASYHYSQELENARSKFYSHHDLKDEDYEYYIGYGNKQEFSGIIYGLKEAMEKELKVDLKTKYSFEGNKSIDEVVTPLFIIHDSDETFLVLKDSKGNIDYQNIKNIESWKITDKKSLRMKDAVEQNFEAHLNEAKTSIKTRDECIVELEILHVDGWAFFDLWHHECEVIDRTDDTVKLKFFELYRAAQFLIIIMEYCKVKHIDQKLSDYMEQKILTNRASQIE